MEPTSTFVRVASHHVDRGRHEWCIVMEDNNGRGQVVVHTPGPGREAVDEARAIFDNRRIWTHDERRDILNANAAIRKAFDDYAQR
jgi:hypothetical protein